MVSIAMATYNGERYIAEQLESIVKQTVLPDEIIVRDDRSSDRTMSIVDEYQRRFPEIHWDVCENETNIGFVKNFLGAIASCNEEIILLCDQDDIWKENKIERIIDFFSDESVLSLHSDIDIVDGDKQIIKKNALDYHKQKENMPLNRFFRHIYYCGMSSAFRSVLKPVILTVDSERLPVHDWLVHAVAVCKGGMYTSSEVLAYRRFHEDNVALNLSKTERKGLQQRINVVEYYCRHYELLHDLMNAFGVNKKDRQLAEKVFHTNVKRKEYLEAGSLSNALKNIVNIKYYPTKRAFLSDLLYIEKVF